MSPTRNTIVATIFNVNSIDDLRYISKALSQRWSELESRGTMNFKRGDSVTFLGKQPRGWPTKSGICYRPDINGIVEKVNRKTITVRTNLNGLVRVSPSLLKPLHEDA